MNNFVQHLVSRHSASNSTIKPRLRGRFEPDNSTNHILSSKMESFESDEVVQNMDEENLSEGNHQKGSSSFSEPKQPTAFLQKNIPHQPNFDKKGKIVTPDTNDGKKGQLIIKEEIQQIQKNSRSIPSDQTESQKPEMEKPWRKTTITPVNTPQQTSFNIEEYTPSISIIPNRRIEAQSSVSPVMPIKPDLQNSMQEQSSESNFFPTSVEQPIIKITIGRIDVRTKTHPKPNASPKKQAKAKPKMSLEDYLKKRDKV